jgi:hypothetical protein
MDPPPPSFDHLGVSVKDALSLLSSFCWSLMVLVGLILQARRRNLIKGINVSMDVFLTHLLFVDDVIIFGAGLFRK